MERVDPLKTELDPRDFGTLVHSALQQLAEDESLRTSTDERMLGKFLVERFDQMTRLRYGTELTLPLVVQLESARQRLRAAAEIEARERAAGWRTERAEWKFALPIGQLTIHGKIDRIDRHADGRIRVLDYKTADVVRAPRLVHLRSIRDSDAARPEWMRVVDLDGKSRAWADLQLPLYLRAVAAEWGENVTVGYFTLPKAVTAAGILSWDDFTPELQRAATRCADGVAAAVSAGTFWPPVELPAREAAWDDFAELFHHGAEASVRLGGESAGLVSTLATLVASATAAKEARA
jgi:ATP-dependent helicase/nuclease subunit B